MNNALAYASMIGPDDIVIEGGEIDKEQEYMMGIDEAGRGPVLGELSDMFAWA